MGIPVRRVNWPTIKLKATPTRNPSSTGLDRKFATKPKRRNPARMQSSPVSRASAVAAATRSSAPTAAKLEKCTRQNDCGRGVGPDHQLSRTGRRAHSRPPAQSPPHRGQPRPAGSQSTGRRSRVAGPPPQPRGPRVDPGPATHAGTAGVGRSTERRGRPMIG